MKHTPSNEASPAEHHSRNKNSFSEEDENVIDVDEGNRALFNQDTINILRQDSPIASKKLRR
jgi:hypothetical protein